MNNITWVSQLNGYPNLGNGDTPIDFVDDEFPFNSEDHLLREYNAFGGSITYNYQHPLAIYVKGGPVRVHGTFRGAYTVVTSGWDAVGGNNCLSDGCAGYDGYVTYQRHANGNSTYPVIDTIRANIWITADLLNSDTAPGQNGGPVQPELEDQWGNPTNCQFTEPGACGSSKHIMGLVSAANVIVANSQANRNNVTIHASIVALNESFTVHYSLSVNRTSNTS